ncbi:PREDICTED: ras suppressor protein 1 [Chaetura pelagica]|uniref:ras suppressor protein 1 n=1 Tax=Chaetura pelagica TaxID=8897 RepID=UPI00052397BC|nr:PREDICTED: ras suppressor protein 1 [Chaetura pelagica]
MVVLDQVVVENPSPRVVRRWHRFPGEVVDAPPRGVQGQAGWGSEQLGLVGGVPATQGPEPGLSGHSRILQCGDGLLLPVVGYGASRESDGGVEDGITLSHITQLVLSHNKLTTVPANIADLRNIEVLNFFNNQIEELPTQISSLQKLKHLNLGMNRLNTLPRGFGSLPALEVLDLTYNNLNENSLPGNFFYLTTLRALYLSDNDFEILPPDIGKLTKLQILSLRDNDLVSLPKEIGELTQLKELHIQGNRLTVLPPELGNLDLTGQKQVFKAENNPWVTPIADQFQLGVSHVFEYIRSETYKYLYGRHMQANPEPPKKNNDKSKKISRKPLAAKNK